MPEAVHYLNHILPLNHIGRPPDVRGAFVHGFRNSNVRNHTGLESNHPHPLDIVCVSVCVCAGLGRS